MLGHFLTRPRTAERALSHVIPSEAQPPLVIPKEARGAD